MPTRAKTYNVPVALFLAITFAVCINASSSFTEHHRGGWTRSTRKTGARNLIGSRTSNAHLAVNIPRGGTDNANYADDSSDETKQLVIIIDVDNTLYSEQDLLSSTGDGIESQIVQNTHLFGQLHFNLTSEKCDELYKKYGSTIEGFRHTVPSEQVEGTMTRFYREVYDAIDYSCLLGISTRKVGTQIIDDDKVLSGYGHGHEKRRALAEFLKSVSLVHPVYLASNSPKAHIARAVSSMGLSGVEFAGILSPDMDYDVSASLAQLGSDKQELIYPTKSSPHQYYKKILERYPQRSNRIILLDDSLHNLGLAESVGIEGIHINQSGRSLEEGLAEALGHILPPETDSTVPSDVERFSFSDVEYLRAKNKVDANAINPSVWGQLAEQLALRVHKTNDGKLRIADLGAGMLFMLELILDGGGEGDRKKPSMLALVNKLLESGREKDNLTPSITKLEYYAYEPNLSLLKGCKERLRRLGFQEINNTSLEGGASSWHASFGPENGIEMTVHLCTIDFQVEQSPPKEVDLIIGCCFADLFDPSQLSLALQRFALGRSRPLVYFPITFVGTTRFIPTYPSVPSQSPRNQMLPSDTTAFGIYSDSLSRHGHNLDSSLIVDAISDHGGSLISKGTSDWIIDPSLNKRLWETMLYFFGMSGGREMTKHYLDATGWSRQSRLNPRTIAVSNVDLLFHLQADSRIDEIIGADRAAIEGYVNKMETKSVQEIQFIAPYNVTTVTKHWDTLSGLSPDSVEIESVCSLISSGTELNVFKGNFESASLDVNIKGMAEEKMEYPLAYGYSLVGRVVACGTNVDDAKSLMGKLVFTFSPHSTRAIVDKDAIQLVPDGIDAEDAIFMPFVETALSLVHDANIRNGENVAVYGQGLIGLLVTSILSMQNDSSMISSSGCFSSVTAFDASEDRLSVSSSLGATSALKPNFASDAGPFDVSIEVSGNPRALQSAIDHTSNNGRIIVGSWYGDRDVVLKLGIDFHRSDKTIQASQVSTIPSSLAGLWSKERRFSFTWALVKHLRPSRLISKRLPLNEVQQAYELLDGRQEVAICFTYD